MNRNRLALIAGTTVVILAAIYFAAIPAIQLGSYHKSEAKHAAVNDKLTRVYDNFKRDVFTKSDSKVASDKIDIDDGRDAIKEAQAVLDANENDLTKFKALPLLSWNSKYKAARDTDKNEEAYVKKARVFLKDYSELLDYTGKETAVEEKFDTIDTDVASIQNATSISGITAAINSVTSKLDSAIGEEKAITPPEYLKASQTSDITSATDLNNTLKELSSAVTSLNLDKINSLVNKIDQDANKFSKQGEQFITELHKDSKIQLEQVELKLLNTKITKGYGQF